jgi:hypothetical protein
MKLGRAYVLVLGVVGCLAAGLVSAAAASATVSTTAASWTPDVVTANENVQQLAQCGGTMYAVGIFAKITQGGQSYARNNAFSFSATTGAVTAWNPNVNGPVNTVAFNSTCTIAYLGGRFSNVDGTAVENLAEVNTTTGAVNPAFAHKANGQVWTLLMVNAGKDLMAGGTFTTINGTVKNYYASLTPSTGAVNSYFSAIVAGKLPPNAGTSMVYNQQLSPKGDHILFEGDFLTIGGAAHEQAAELHLSSTTAGVDPWSNHTLNTTHCSVKEQFYEQAGAFSPDESTVYLAATGFHGNSPYCDTVAAFANTKAATNLWINKTGGDSLFSIAASANNIYIAGHERWANNPKGFNNCGAGCVSRPGIGDISPATGLATSWDPTRDRGHGADDLVITSAGLWVASDTFFNSVKCDGVYHPGICFFPGVA